jgi:cold shock protein
VELFPGVASEQAGPNQDDVQFPEKEADYMTGSIKTLRADKGFGFIKGSDGSQYFFHQSAIYGEGIEMLREGDSVEFELGPEGPKGPRAESVRRTST